MPEITLPEVKLPDFKWPESLRDMTREDFVNAAKDVHLPKMDLRDIDLSKVDLPKEIRDRLPGRKRTNPMVPLAGLVALGAMIAGVWWLFTSSVTGPRMRSAARDLKNRMTGERTDLVRYDDDADLGSLLSNGTDANRSSMASKPYESSTAVSDLGEGVPVGPGEMPKGVRTT